MAVMPLNYYLILGNEPDNLGFTLPYAGTIDRSRVVDVFLGILFAAIGVNRICKAMSQRAEA